MLPSMWRVELWHPLSVHFPIALLVIGTACRLLGLLFSWRANKYVSELERREHPTWTDFLFRAGQFMTFLGTLSAWIAWYLGNQAEEEVNSRLCDPSLTHLHGDNAFYVTMIFTGVSLCDIATLFLRRSLLSIEFLARFLMSRYFRLLVVLVAVGGVALLTYVAHLGASLTYNQAAGVYRPSEQCTEFAVPPEPAHQ